MDPYPVIDGRRANCNLAILGRPGPAVPFGRSANFPCFPIFFSWTPCFPNCTAVKFTYDSFQLFKLLVECNFLINAQFPMYWSHHNHTFSMIS
jgi:hypothetical protein